MLSTPFSMHRGIHQGFPLLGMLYALAIESLLHELQHHLSVVALPSAMDPSIGPLLQLLAYADDMTIFLNSQEDVWALICVPSLTHHRTYSRGSSASW